jgi:uncharacterized repeat protein (TIGR04076 family)
MVFLKCLPSLRNRLQKISLDATEKWKQMKQGKKLVVRVKEIRGHCPVFKVGDKIVFDEPEIILEETDALCIHALGAMLSMLVALSRGTSFKKLGLTKKEEVGYIQCLDPGPPYTSGGTVVFEIRRESEK